LQPDHETWLHDLLVALPALLGALKVQADPASRAARVTVAGPASRAGGSYGAAAPRGAPQLRTTVAKKPWDRQRPQRPPSRAAISASPAGRAISPAVGAIRVPLYQSLP
jgi:hypothetical protein